MALRCVSGYATRGTPEGACSWSDGPGAPRGMGEDDREALVAVRVDSPRLFAPEAGTSPATDAFA